MQAPTPNPTDASDRAVSPDALGALEHDARHVADEPPVGPAPARARRLRRVVKWGVAIVVLAFVVQSVRSQLDQADFGDVAFRWPWAVLACVVLSGLYASLMTSERLLLRAFTGAALPWRQMVPVAWVPLAGKYVPGKFAAVAGAVMLLRRAGVPTAPALSVFLVLDSMPILTGTVLAALLLMAPEVRPLVPIHPAVLVSLALAAAACIHPAPFGRLINLGLRLLGRRPLPRVPTLGDYVGPILTTFGQWGSNAGAVFLMCVAFAPPGEGPGLAQFPAVVGITALVMCVSYFAAVIVPQGVGVREWLFIPLLSTIVPAPAAVAVTVAMRLAHTVVELTLCAAGLLLLRQLDQREPAAAADRPRM